MQIKVKVLNEKMNQGQYTDKETGQKKDFSNRLALCQCSDGELIEFRLFSENGVYTGSLSGNIIIELSQYRSGFGLVSQGSGRIISSEDKNA